MDIIDPDLLRDHVPDRLRRRHRAQYPVTDTIFTDISITGAQQSGDAFDAKSGYGIWANQLPEAGQGPAVGSVTFNHLTESNNFVNIQNTTSTFTITVNP